MKRCLSLSFFFAIAISAWADTMPAFNCPGGMQDLTSNAAVTFGGAGIPKNAVCFATFGDVQIGLTATSRYSNLPLVTNDGNHTYFAPPGNDSGSSVDPQAGFARWNFDFYAHNNSTTTDYLVELLWDTDPGAGTSVGFVYGQLGHTSGTSTAQDSWNLGMSFIDTGIANATYSPSAMLFDPNVTGVYSFGFIAKTTAGANLGSIAMQVNETPEPSTYALLLIGFAGMVYARRRFSAAQ